MEVVWTNLALEDLQAIRDYIALGSTKYAERFVNQVFRRTSLLSTFPMVGRKVPEFDKEHIRELFYQSYRIVYRIESKQISVLRVRHQAQQRH